LKEDRISYVHARIRENVESISFYKREEMERSNGENKPDDVIKGQSKVAGIFLRNT